MKKRFFYLRMCLIWGLVLFLGNAMETRADVKESEETAIVEEERVYVPFEELQENLYFEPETRINLYSARASWQDIIKARFMNAVETCEQTISYADLLSSATSSEIVSYIRDLEYRSPYAFYIDGFYNYGNRIEFVYESDYVTNNVLDVSKVRSDMAKISAEVDLVLSGISDNMSELEKALYLHDWIVEQVDYAHEELLEYEQTGYLPWWTQKAYSVFLYNKTVCAGYAQCYSYLLSQAGMESYIVNSDALHHAWNLVKVDGAWYHVDCTWDDPVFGENGNNDYWLEGYVGHTNFLRSDAGIMSTDHQEGGQICWEKEGLPAVSTTEPYANYFFMSEISPMYYVNGLWFYADIDGPYGGDGVYTEGDYVVRSSITGDDFSQNESLSDIVNMHIYEGKVYIATADKVYSTLPSTLGDNTVLEDYSSKGKILEFALKDDNLVVVYRNSQGGYTRDLIDLSTQVEYTSRLEIVHLPNKLTYDLGESLDTTGLLVNAVASDGRWISVEDACTVTGFNSNRLGRQTITISYGGMSTSFEVEVYGVIKDTDVSINSAYYYTGSAIKPTPVVKCNGVKLINGTDYTVSYGTNVTGTGKVVVTGLGNYSGTITKTFEIKPAQMDTTKLKVNLSSTNYSGYSDTIEFVNDKITVVYAGRTLVNGTDYTISDTSLTIVSNQLIKLETQIVFKNYIVANGSSRYTYTFEQEFVLNKTSVSMNVGESTWISAVYKNTNYSVSGLSYSSSAPSIVKVDSNGKITAVSTGKATITVTKNGQSETCVVEVKQAAQNNSGNSSQGGTQNGSGTQNNGGSQNSSGSQNSGTQSGGTQGGSQGNVTIVIRTGWQCYGDNWYYRDQNGQFVKGWLYDGGNWYYMNSVGAMQTGWVNDGSTWYYMSPSGVMQTGWVNDGGTWYYMNGSGAMQTGWVNDGGTWYYMNGSGAMATGWVNDGGAWYYMNGSGAMATGWVYTGGKWYYMYSSGAMAANTTIDGCRLNASGAWVK